MPVESLSEAGHYVEHILRGKGYNVLNVRPFNRGRHAAIATEKDGEQRIYYVLFKRERFLTYSRYFDDIGFGESINVEFFNAIQRSKHLHYILFVYPDGYVYYITPEEWREFTKDKDTIRWTNQGESTVSVRIDLLHRWDRDMTVQELERWLEDPSLVERLKITIRNAISRLRGRKT